MTKRIIIGFFVIFIMTSINFVYATERLVDIPVPPKDTDVNKMTGENKTEDYVGKSGNNYLKNLQINGYTLVPNFNSQVSDYTIYAENSDNIKQLEVIAEKDNDRASIEGDGIVNINQEQKLVNINVIAENGNLRVYTIRIKKSNEFLEEQKNGVIILVITIIFISTILCAEKLMKNRKGTSI